MVSDRAVGWLIILKVGRRLGAGKKTQGLRRDASWLADLSFFHDIVSSRRGTAVVNMSSPLWYFAEFSVFSELTGAFVARNAILNRERLKSPCLAQFATQLIAITAVKLS